MNLRPIESDDIDEIISIRGRTRQNAISEESLVALGITADVVAEKLRTTHRGWLCEDGKTIAGFAIGDGTTGELWVIAVLPEFERRGVGSRLLNVVEEWLWSVGNDELWLWTSTDEGLRAFSFYVGRGWRKGEVKDGALYMRKQRPNNAPKPTPGSVALRSPA